MRELLDEQGHGLLEVQVSQGPLVVEVVIQLVAHTHLHANQLAEFLRLAAISDVADKYF